MIRGAADGSGTSTVTELARRLQLAQSTITELVRRAEDAGLVEREVSGDDARVAHLRITAEGERRLSIVAESLGSERDELRAALDLVEWVDGGATRRAERVPAAQPAHP